MMSLQPCRLSSYRRYLLSKSKSKHSAATRCMSHSPQSESISSEETQPNMTQNIIPYSRSDPQNGADWRNWFSAAEYRNNWQSPTMIRTRGGKKYSSWTLLPLDHEVLDKRSRHLLQLLQTMYHVGLTETEDRVTIERCQAILEALADDKKFTGKKNIMWQRASRADAILQAMELFVPLSKSVGKLRQSEPWYRLPWHLPVPNYQAYWSVLRLYSSKFLSGSSDVPLRCQEIVETMERSNHISLKPKIIHWNQVLCAWANSDDRKRPLHAAQLLYDLHMSDTRPKPDASSFSHALRACVSIKQRGQETSNREFMELAGKVAIRLWIAIHEASDSITIDTYHYVHMLRACRNLLPDDPQRDEWTLKVFQECIANGRVNVHVLREVLFLATSSPKIQRFFRPYLSDCFDLFNDAKDKTSSDPLVLIRKVPQEWTKHIDADSKYGW